MLSKFCNFVFCMISTNNSKIYTYRLLEFVWQHIWLLISLFVMTFGVALCVRSNLGSSVISSIPMAFSLAGEEYKVPGLTIGGYTNIMNFILVGLQIIILRRRFEAIQLLQLVIGIIFGAFIDLNMIITSYLDYSTLLMQIVAQFLGCSVMALGISAEVRCGSVTMPGEGIQVAISKVSGLPFAKVKILVDSILVILAVASCYVFWGSWQWNIIGAGTLFAMLYVGYCVKILSRHLGWFDKILGYRPGVGRFLFGLARYIYKKRD